MWQFVDKVITTTHGPSVLQSEPILDRAVQVPLSATVNSKLFRAARPSRGRIIAAFSSPRAAPRIFSRVPSVEPSFAVYRRIPRASASVSRAPKSVPAHPSTDRASRVASSRACHEVLVVPRGAATSRSNGRKSARSHPSGERHLEAALAFKSDV